MKNKLTSFLAGIICIVSLPSCNEYLDIVPNDGIATLDMAFNMRSQAFKYLASCYKYLATLTPGYLDYVGFAASDEMDVAMNSTISDSAWKSKISQILWGQQNVTSVYGNDFQTMYQAIRYCNTMVDEIDKVPDMPVWEKEQWKAEAKTLKAFYYFNLVRKWGPVPIVKENLPVSADMETSRVSRNTIDECFDYMLEILDEAIPALYDKPQSLDEYGRVTAPVAAMLKAKIAVTAASPLFNGNDDFSILVNKDGTQLFPKKTEDQKHERWAYAMKACEEAIAICERGSYNKLYTYDGSFHGDSHLVMELTLRERICEDFNVEVIWANTQQDTDMNKSLQRITGANSAAEQFPDLWYFRTLMNVPMKIANQYYTKHGVPVENDLERKGVKADNLRVGTTVDDEKWYIQSGYETAEFNFDREPRFYADISFDGGYWLNSLNNDQTPEQLPKVKRGLNLPIRTGYGIKKLSKHSQVINSSATASITFYIFPIFRLADLFLLYAEAINEAEGPDGEHSEMMFKYIDAVRSRAGIPGVKEAWDTYSDMPGKYSTQIGMRDIIRRERGIEMAFEGERFWDIRRWKTAPAQHSEPVYGWNNTYYTSKTRYYQVTYVTEHPFIQRDYFWPFSTALLENNPNLVQNIGW